MGGKPRRIYHIQMIENAPIPPMEIPVDPKRCQAEKPNGESFMTLGGGHKMVRCENRPVWLAYELKPNAKDGLRGSMALCPACRKVHEKQEPGTAGYQRLAYLKDIAVFTGPT